MRKNKIGIDKRVLIWYNGSRFAEAGCGGCKNPVATQGRRDHRERGIPSDLFYEHSPATVHIKQHTIMLKISMRVGSRSHEDNAWQIICQKRKSTI